MRLAVLGGTGKIGGLVVEQALAAGHEVTVLVRDRGRLPSLGESTLVRVVDGDVRDADVVARVVERADVVISALGPNGNTPDQVGLLGGAMSNTIEAMRRHGVKRIVNLSGAAVDAPGDRKPLLDWIASRIVASSPVTWSQPSRLSSSCCARPSWIGSPRDHHWSPTARGPAATGSASTS